MKLKEAINSAIEYEEKVYQVYLRASEQVANPDAKKILNHLAKEEKYHLEYLHESLNRLNSGEKQIFDKLKTKMPSPEEIEKSLARLKAHLDRKSPNVVDPEEERNILEKALLVSASK